MRTTALLEIALVLLVIVIVIVIVLRLSRFGWLRPGGGRLNRLRWGWESWSTDVRECRNWPFDIL